MERALIELLGESRVLTGDAAERAYDCDAYTVHRQHPNHVAFPETTEEAAAIVRLCNEQEIPFTPRGAGTGLSGGALPAQGGVVIATTRMRKILEIDAENRLMLAQTGCPNLALTKAVEHLGLHFAPDPSSQTVCTLGGNIAENSGGPHTLKYGVTADHVTGLTMVMPSGVVRTLGGKVWGGPGLDLVGFIVGGEGTLGIVTEAWVRLTPVPTVIRTVLAAFPSVRDATQSVSDIIAAGIVPAALEMMDHVILEAVEKAFGLGLPTDAMALLLIECDGDNAPDEIAQCEVILRRNNAEEIRTADNAADRANLWIARKKGIGAIGRLSPSMVTHDGVIPRSKLPEMLEFVAGVADKAGLRVANIFHAGDGNLHPIFLFDDREPDQVDRVVRAGHEVMMKCLSLGGSVTGEHGIGVEKIDLLGKMFSEDDLRLQAELKSIFNPTGNCNPGKVLPSEKTCVEVRVRRRAAH
ncbi:MAG: FAD-binding protein [Armatimonadota bacterium]|nr:FAD-binding protein [Armatimonadota bacterium]